MTDHEFDTEYTDEAICPWCGYEHKDSWEFLDGEAECESCSRPFSVSKYVSVTYSTNRIVE